LPLYRNPSTKLLALGCQLLARQKDKGFSLLSLFC